MIVWGIVMELITSHLTLNIDQRHADERPNRCSYTPTHPFPQAIPFLLCLYSVCHLFSPTPSSNLSLSLTWNSRGAIRLRESTRRHIISLISILTINTVEVKYDERARERERQEGGERENNSVEMERNKGRLTGRGGQGYMRASAREREREWRRERQKAQPQVPSPISNLKIARQSSSSDLLQQLNEKWTWRPMCYSLFLTNLSLHLHTPNLDLNPTL